MSHTYEAAYVSLAVALAGDVLAVQREVCRRYALIPRKELHLTIGFLGQNTARRLVDLAAALIDEPLAPGIARIGLAGLGGAHEVAGRLRLITDETSPAAMDDPRVLWLAATATDELTSFRARVVHAAAAVGVTTPIGGEVFPHLTLGSAGPLEGGDWTLWDVHTVPKRATISFPGVPAEVRASKLHVTDVSIHPDSVHLLRPFPAAI